MNPNYVISIGYLTKGGGLGGLNEPPQDPPPILILVLFFLALLEWHSIKKNVVGTQKNRLNEIIILSTLIKCLN